MKKFTEFFMINLGLLLVAAGIVLFKIPNKFVTGGVSGVSIILEKYIQNAPVGLIMLIVNLLLVFLGFIFLGKSFASKTIYASVVLAGMVWALEQLFQITQPFTPDTFLELIFAIMLPAVGSGIVFNYNSSTGGTDIIAKILNKYTSINIGKTLLMADFGITFSSFFVFGIRVGMYSILGLILRAFIIDLVIESMNISKEVKIVSKKPEEVKKFIVFVLKRGATVHTALGAFTNEQKEVITTIVNRRQAIKLRNFVREIDSDSFISITNTSETIGRGFRNVG